MSTLEKEIGTFKINDLNFFLMKLGNYQIKQNNKGKGGNEQNIKWIIEKINKNKNGFFKK